MKQGSMLPPSLATTVSALLVGKLWPGRLLVKIARFAAFGLSFAGRFLGLYDPNCSGAVADPSGRSSFRHQADACHKNCSKVLAASTYAWALTPELLVI